MSEQTRETNVHLLENFLIAASLSFELTCAKDEREQPVQLRLRKEIVFLAYGCLNHKLAQAI